MDIDILIEAQGWTGLAALARFACPAVLREVGLQEADYTVSILGCDDARIAGLNGTFRGKPLATNVLAWPAAELSPPERPMPGELGDIAIAFETCAREAAEQGKPFDHHVSHLLVHATLHLLGYDHATYAEAAEMESIESVTLARLGIPDPY
ncbi:MAG: rRNA maturation RNase YbeY [Pseudomonadota bacterium]